MFSTFKKIFYILKSIVLKYPKIILRILILFNIVFIFNAFVEKRIIRAPGPSIEVKTVPCYLAIAVSISLFIFLLFIYIRVIRNENKKRGEILAKSIIFTVLSFAILEVLAFNPILWSHNIFRIYSFLCIYFSLFYIWLPLIFVWKKYYIIKELHPHVYNPARLFLELQYFNLLIHGFFNVWVLMTNNWGDGLIMLSWMFTFHVFYVINLIIYGILCKYYKRKDNIISEDN